MEVMDAQISSDKPARRVQHIIDNARAVFEYTAGMDLDGFRDDRRTRDAVERCLNRISEAATRLGDLAPMWMPEQPWPNLRALAGYEYDRISVDEVWAMVETKLPSLCADCERAIGQLPSAQPL
jgi:uncharacterized protein with HEPN domain